jgi:hypothetical protein
MQRIPNFGSLLQSYSLKKNLEQIGYEVYFIDIMKNEEDNKLLNGNCDDFSDECDRKNGVLSKLSKLDRYVLNRINIRKRADMQDFKFDEFRKSILRIKDEDNKKSYDACIIGSDEVFNCKGASHWGFTSQLFGNVCQASNVITYAASCGSTLYESLPIAVQEKIRHTFMQVSGFSVRDENTNSFVSNLTNKPVYNHMDPVVIESFDEEIAASRLPDKLPDHFCIVYSYYNRIHDKAEIRAIQEFCKRKKLKLVTVGAPQMWIKNHLVLTPFEMLKVFQKADFVITDTFHGTIFSAKFTKRFATMTRVSNKNKLLDLVYKLGIEKHLISSMDQLSEVYNYEKNQNIVNDISTKERFRAMHYLVRKL